MRWQNVIATSNFTHPISFQSFIIDVSITRAIISRNVIWYDVGNFVISSQKYHSLAQENSKYWFDFARLCSLFYQSIWTRTGHEISYIVDPIWPSVWLNCCNNPQQSEPNGECLAKWNQVSTTIETEICELQKLSLYCCTNVIWLWSAQILFRPSRWRKMNFVAVRNNKEISAAQKERFYRKYRCNWF